MRPGYVDTTDLQKRYEKAIQAAKQELKTNGIEYPIYDSSLPADINLDRQRYFSEREASLIAHYMQEKEGGERPLVINSTVGFKRQWGSSWYDD